MADNTVFSPADDILSPNSSIDITIEEISENSEELLDDEGEEGFEIKSNELEDDVQNYMQKVEKADLENALVVESDDLNKNADQLVIIQGVNQEDNIKSVIIESNGHEEQILDATEACTIDASVQTDNGYAIDACTLDTSYQTTHTQDMSHLPPFEGMEFESYDDAYNYYYSYAKELGFGIRVKSSWTMRNSKEKRGAVLCCNCEGFKTMKAAGSRRKETRTGCLAMIRLRLVESNRWKLDEVKLEHNHVFDHQKAQNCRSHKKMEAGSKRKSEPPVDFEVQTIKLYRTKTVDSVSLGSSSERDVEVLKSLKFRNGDIEALNNYFRQAQLVDPNFFYIIDINDEGYMQNVFWIDSRSRAAYRYFGDVVLIDTTCIQNKYEIPLLSFTGSNHHGRPVLLGCGLLADESTESYHWVMRAWLTCMSGRPPQTIVTSNCKELQGAIAEVFARAHHRFYLPVVMQSIIEELELGGESEMFQLILNRTVYASMKVEEFEMRWDEMIQHFGFMDNEWLRNLYEERERWVPVYSKNTVLAGVFTSHPDEYMNSFFHGYLHHQISWSEFFKVYESLQRETIQREVIDDSESQEFVPVLRTRFIYEMKGSELYSKEIFVKFQEQVVMMSRCFSIAQVDVNGAISTYIVKERDDDGEATSFEVVHDKVGMEVRCICGCFSFRGYLCRHALSVLNYMGVEELPSQYMLSRWRKDTKRVYVVDVGSNKIDISNPVQWYDHLYRRGMEVVAEGMSSRDHQRIAWQALKESLNEVRLVSEKRV